MIKKFIKLILHLPRLLTSRLRKLPEFIIVGVQKGGTTSLFHYLNLHPNISMSSLKEVHYFDNNFNKGINWYKSYFPLKVLSGNTISGEASPYYIFHPHALKRIKALLPNVKIIIVFRDPIERAYSHYKMEFRKGKESLSFKDAIAKESSRIDYDLLKMHQDESFNSYNFQTFSYLSRGLYGHQLTNVFKYFQKENVCILQSEDLLNSPESELTRVYNFLNVPIVLPDKFEIYNKGNSKKLDNDTMTFLNDYYLSDRSLFNQIMDSYNEK